MGFFFSLLILQFLSDSLTLMFLGSNPAHCCGVLIVLDCKLTFSSGLAAGDILFLRALRVALVQNCSF